MSTKVTVNGEDAGDIDGVTIEYDPAKQCPRCSSDQVSNVGFVVSTRFTGSKGDVYRCRKCGKEWTVERFEGIDDVIRNVS